MQTTLSLVAAFPAKSHTATRRRFSRFAWGALAYNVLVVLWGAFVRASYSGDGCGSHWPLCNGEVIPTAPVVKTVIEFSHRVTSGIALIIVILMVAWARRLFAPAHPARRATRWALFFTITEAIIGAGLVIFGLVADDDSVARALSLSVHLINTFILLAALTLVAWYAVSETDDDAARGIFMQERTAGGAKWIFGSAFVGMLMLGASGAIAALGDTLFPVTSLAQAWSQEASDAAHVLVRLRVLHPVVAGVVAVNLLCAVWLALRAARGGQLMHVKRIAWAVVALLVMQMLAGGVNVLLLAPVWMQIAHLLLADALWIAFILLGAATFAVEPAVQLVPGKEPQPVTSLGFVRT